MPDHCQTRFLNPGMRDLAIQTTRARHQAHVQAERWIVEQRADSEPLAAGFGRIVNGHFDLGSSIWVQRAPESRASINRQAACGSMLWISAVRVSGSRSSR